MKQATFTLTANEQIAQDIYCMTLTGDASDVTRSGQFVNLSLPGHYLRRPISVADFTPRGVSLLYKVVGEGTAQMASMLPGTQLDLLTGLGNGFSLPDQPRNILLVGGGIGAAPLYHLTKDLIGLHCQVTIVLGFTSWADCFYLKRFQELGARVYVSTVQGDVGTKGFVTDAIRAHNIQADYFYACGPMPMLSALCHSLDYSGEVSLEARMGCGFGICMGCSIETTQGPQRVCKEGPVFRKEELIW